MPRPMLMKNAVRYAALEASAVEEAFGGRRVRHGQDSEIGAGKTESRRGALGGYSSATPSGAAVRRASVASTVTPKAASRRAAAPADVPPSAHDPQRRRFGQMHDIAGSRAGPNLPFAAQLLRNEQVQSAGKGQHECQNVRADMVIHHLAEVRDAMTAIGRSARGK